MADTYGSMSPQGAISGLGDAGNQDGTDNNCQNLNIWTPGLKDGQKRPVMVWLHGGGFSSGSANGEEFDGEALSRSGDVVVVGVNHRLNVFGYLDLAAYGEKYKDSFIWFFLFSEERGTLLTGRKVLPSDHPNVSMRKPNL